MEKLERLERFERQRKLIKESGLQICGTFGPSCHEKKLLAAMAACGMNAMRLNTNHCSLQEAEPWIRAWEKACEETGIKGRLLVDLQKGSLRTVLEKPVVLSLNERADVNLLGLPSAVREEMQKDDILLLDDGRIRLQVLDDKTCQVLEGGILENHKNVCLENRELERPSLSEQDLQTLQQAAAAGADGLMIPFVEGAADLQHIKKLAERYCPGIRILAKIETLKGAEQIERILPWCDEIVMARGDLGNDAGLTRLPAVCETIRQACLRAGKPWMVVTQMLDSMRHHPKPTRAEVSDVFYAVLLGAKSIMLTNETAAGEYPLEAMEVFCETACSALESD